MRRKERSGEREREGGEERMHGCTQKGERGGGIKTACTIMQ